MGLKSSLSDRKMYYLFRAQTKAKKPTEKKLPKVGKVVLLLFFLFHVAFIGFNFWYFYYSSPDNASELNLDDAPAVEYSD